ncbi:RagB/SusD family nutrient uptake outer membrane protein [Algoriphagus jejuensis]|uniref:RagB/SusD family nutrient uptake outer membrane protein n=1 Tax=Algoriphagus jejuensis TaxID=419934 RepID=A0ABP3YG82_9BACT
MKKTALIFIVILGLGACNVLDQDPQDSLDANMVLVDGASANSILNGVYSTMGSDYYYGVEYVLNMDLIADNSVFQGFYDSQLEIDQMTVPFTNLFVTESWPVIYRVINSANLLIEGVPSLDDPNFSNENDVLGQAYGLRALAFFDLLRVFGEHYIPNSSFGLPLLLQPIPENDFNQIPNIPRSTVAQTYAQINEDLDLALSFLTESLDQGTMNYYAALALRARVALYQKNYAVAKAAADEIIADGGFELLDDLDELYYTTEITGETIFDLEFNDQDQSSFNSYTIRRDEYNLDERLINATEAGDKRAAYYGFSRNANRILKYTDGTNANNTKVFRLAEIYLIRAEADAMLSGNPNSGLADINTIRQRADLAPIQSLPSMDAFVNALLQERRVELAFEGHRFFDLVRFDKTGAVMGIPDFRKIFPIPRNELQVAEPGILAQNPGYETL